MISFIIGIIRLNKKYSKQVCSDNRAAVIFENCKKKLGISKNIKLVICEGRKAPCIFGIFNPTVLIDKENLNYDSESLKYVFLHELSHCKRYDMAFNYVLLLILCIHWFNPIIWFLFKKIRQDIEIGADELAVKGLRKSEKNQYALVLLEFMKINRSEETRNLLCLSDNLKNIKRRISMLKGRSKSIIISIVIVIIVAIVVICTVFFRASGNENKRTKVNNATESSVSVTRSVTDKADGLTDTDNYNHKTAEDISAKDKQEGQAVIDYINILCNRNVASRLPVFDNINKADKVWIYSHIDRDKYTFYISEKELEDNLRQLFGDSLVIDVKKDTSSEDDISMPKFDEAEEKYMLPAFEFDYSYNYTISDIQKNNDEYTATLVEYVTGTDYEKNETVIFRADEAGDFKEVFREKPVDSEEDSKKQKKEIEKTVLNRKNEFKIFKAIVKKNSSSSFNVVKVYQIK